MERDLILSRALILLRTADIRISGGDMEALSLTVPDRGAHQARVHLVETPPTPSKLAAVLERKVRTLIVTSRPTAALLAAASKDLIDLITVSPGVVIIGGVHYLQPDEPAAPAEKTHGRIPWGRWAMLRAFALADKPLNQQELATLAGISQPAVNKHLKSLTSLVDRGQAGWKAHNVGDIISWWADNYPGPRGVSSYWYSLKSPAKQAEAAAAYARDLGASPLISGDAAADIYAPWRLPDSVQIYLREAVDFTDAGFSPASQEEATLIATVPEDRTLWSTALLVHATAGLPLADPLVALCDVLSSVAADSEEAADHLREAIVSGAAR